MIINKYTRVKLRYCLFFVDGIIVIAMMFVTGKLETLFLSLLAIAIVSLLTGFLASSKKTNCEETK
jgi:uncharacterized membrane-anchored protein YitT (DUF2179 family)